jgi:hypothetical protein
LFLRNPQVLKQKFTAKMGFSQSTVFKINE